MGGDVFVPSALIASAGNNANEYLAKHVAELGYLRPTIVGMYNYVQPIVASLIGVCLGLDSFNVLKGFAVVLIFTGVYLVTISKAAPAPTPQK